VNIQCSEGWGNHWILSKRLEKKEGNQKIICCKSADCSNGAKMPRIFAAEFAAATYN
jgi:hypothetical protein